jgi:hypothetical protein
VVYGLKNAVTNLRASSDLKREGIVKEAEPMKIRRRDMSEGPQIVSTAILPIKKKRGEAFSEHRAANLGQKATLNEFEFGTKLGEGAYAIVRQCVHKKTRDSMAIKVYDKYKLNDP